MNWYLKVLKHYADFSGRARRKEFWMFVFFNIIFSTVAMFLDNVLGIALESIGVGPLFTLYILAMLIPGLAVAVRRLHDIGKNGRLILIGLIPVVGAIWLLVLFASDSEPNENEYGANPKMTETVDSTGEQLIFVYIILAFCSHILYTVVPKINIDFYHSILDVTAISLIFLLGITPLAMVLSLKNKSLKIITFIPGVIMFLYSIHELGIQLVK